LVDLRFSQKDQTKKPSAVFSSNFQCDGCQGFQTEARFKCASCPDFDLCTACFSTIELQGDTSKDEEFAESSCHERGVHAFWVIKDFKLWDIQIAPENKNTQN
jgi:hypothetical protein